MKEDDIERIVAMVLGADSGEVSLKEIARRIVDLGVEPAEAPSIIEAIFAGSATGIDGRAAGGYTAGEDPFFDLAFKKTRADNRFTTPFWVLAKGIGMILIAAAVLGAALAVILWIAYS